MNGEALLAVERAAVYNASVARVSKDPRRGPAQAGSLGFTLVVLVLVFIGLGYVLDRWLHTGPWLMAAGVFVGFGLGSIYMVFVTFADSPGTRGGKKGEDGHGGNDQR